MKQKITDLSIVVLVALLILALCEFGARVHKRSKVGKWKGTHISEQFSLRKQTEPMRRQHHFLITGPNENTTVRALGKEAVINSMGYRSPERIIAKREGEYRILCMGGSTTFDLTVSSNKHTWPAQLEDFLKSEAASQDITVWNAGFPGWSSVENTISLFLRDVDIKPDLIVLFQGINDLKPMTFTPFDPQYEKGHGELRYYKRKMKPLRFYHHSVFLENLHRIFYNEQGFSFQEHPMNYYQGQLLDRIPEEAIHTYTRNLLSIKGIANAHGARLVVIPQILHIRKSHPEFDMDYVAGWVRTMPPHKTIEEIRRVNKEVQAFCKSELIHFLDPEDLITWEDEDFFDPMHFTDTGSRKFARFLERGLKEVL